MVPRAVLARCSIRRCEGSSSGQVNRAACVVFSMDNRPVGRFDSGVGGLTIWRAIRKLLPHENLAYIADQQRFPAV